MSENILSGEELIEYQKETIVMVKEYLTKLIPGMNNSIAERIAKIAESKGSVVEESIDAFNSQICTCNANDSANKDKTCYSAIDEKSKGNGKDYRVANAYIRQLTNVEGSYDASTNVCTITKKQYNCTKYLSPSCRTFDEGKVLDTSSVQMSKFK